MLGELATKTDRPDGWMVLDKADTIIRKLEPWELTDLGKRFGHRTLKRLLLATELFDVEDEPTPKGGRRTVYRINSRYELQVLRPPDGGQP